MQRVTKKKTVDSVLAVAESAVEAEVEKKKKKNPLSLLMQKKQLWKKKKSLLQKDWLEL